ncbi:MAG: AAA family ATPase, partial [Anaerolineales bacterium]
MNVLIGPNGSGKSNLIEAIDVVRASVNDLHAAIRRGGGVHEWIWKGNKKQPAVRQLQEIRLVTTWVVGINYF